MTVREARVSDPFTWAWVGLPWLQDPDLMLQDQDFQVTRTTVAPPESEQASRELHDEVEEDLSGLLPGGQKTCPVPGETNFERLVW